MLPSSVEQGSDVKGVFACCTWLTTPEQVRQALFSASGWYGPVVDFANRNRFAVLAWTSKEVWDKTRSADEQDKGDYRDEDSRFDDIARAWDRAVSKMARKHGIPEGDYFFSGISRGAQWGHRLILRQPERFLAAHIHVNSSYDKPTEGASRVFWLATTGELEVGYAAARRFYAECREMNYPILFKAGVGLGHAGSSRINAIGKAFFDYALDLKQIQDPMVRRATLMRELDRAPMIGDLLNQAVYPRAEADIVPEPNRVALPADCIARVWRDDVWRPLVTYSVLDGRHAVHFIARMPAALSPPSNPAAIALLASTDHRAISFGSKVRYSFGDGSSAEAFADRQNVALVSWSVEAHTEAGADAFASPVVAALWERGLTGLCERYNLPKNRLLLIGMDSERSRWLLDFFRRYPGSLITANAFFMEEKPIRLDLLPPVPCFLTADWYVGRPFALDAFGACQKKAIPAVVRLDVDPDRTQFSGADALAAFLDGVLNSRDIYTQFKSPPYWGDARDSRMIDPLWVEKIPKEFRVPLFSKELARAWSADGALPSDQTIKP
jgi:hypothetical protein